MLVTCFQVVFINFRGAIASAQRLLDVVGILHHVLQLILNILHIKRKQRVIHQLRKKTFIVLNVE